MSRLTPPPQKGSFYPPNDAATYRDLLLFEERLKTNASSLNRRKSRYQLFLAQLLAIIIFLVSEVMLQTQFMSIPYKFLLRKALPEIYTETTDVQLHPYFASGLLTVAVTTLALFFASGMYSEKIGYANRYVPHANRSLRNFNMYLNVRRRPLRAMLLYNPLAFFFPRATPSAQPPPSPHLSDRERGGRIPPKRGGSVPIPPIPPTTNPRGELIFSSRVDRTFREAYERYRAAFERRRAERAAAAAARTWRGAALWPWNWGRARAPPPLHHGRAHSPAGAGLRGRGAGPGSSSAGSTPASSRRPSPAPGSQGRAKGEAASRSGTPPGGVPARLLSDRTRKESFSFLLSGDENLG